MSQSNPEQAEFWTHFAGVWVTHQADLDALMAPVLARVLDRAGIESGRQVLDIGCGTGTSTLLAAEAAGAEGHVLGVDISAPMIDRARALAATRTNISFALTDAAEHQFEPGRFDQVISRFGVMFFNDPVAAFTNIRKGVRPGGTFTMAAWSALDANPWFLHPMRAAKARLGAPPSLDPDAPGPLAFRDIDRVCGLLEAAGLTDVRGEAEALDLTPPGDLRRVCEHACLIGPAARTMEYFEGTEDDFAAIASIVEESFVDYIQDGAARIPARINVFTARAPG
jgi:SAM-dependent methyltransferase